jgi:hypothetical protein
MQRGVPDLTEIKPIGAQTPSPGGKLRALSAKAAASPRVKPAGPRNDKSWLSLRAKLSNLAEKTC